MHQAFLRARSVPIQSLTRTTTAVLESKNSSLKRCNITELAIKFILSQKQISVILPTIISVEEIELFTSLSDGKYLNSAEIERMEEMYEKNFYVEPVVK